MINIRYVIKTILLIIVANSPLYAQVVADSINVPSKEESEQEARFHNDWANLKYYHNDNVKANQNYPSKNRVVMMGNSITEMWKVVHPDFFGKHKNFINRGISGQTTPQMLLRFRQDVIDLKPNTVVIMGGTNDIAGNTGPATLNQIFGNLVSMMQLAKANGIKVIISSVLPAEDYPWVSGKQPASKIVKLNNLLKAYAKLHGIVYLDYHTAVKNSKNGLKEDLTQDGVHPNKKGYLVMEPLLENALRKN